MYRLFRGASVDLLSPIEVDHPLNVGRTAWWLGLPGSAGGPTWYDLTSNRGATLTNGPTWGPSSRTGGAQKLACVTGSNQYAQHNAAAAAGYPCTLSAWFRLGSNPGSGVSRMLLAIQNASTIDNLFMDVYNNSGTYNLRGVAENGISAGINNYAFTPDTGWHHAVATFTDASTRQMYLDGVAGGSAQGGADTSAVGTLTSTSIGLLTYSTSTLYGPFDGDLDDLSVWNRVLSATEVAALYREAMTGYRETLRRVRSRSMVSAATSNRVRLVVCTGTC